MAMKKRWNNLAARWLVLVLVALFAAPCIACDDGMAHLLCPHAHDAVQAVHLATHGCGCDICGTPHQEAPPCQCLSDTPKVHSYRSQTTLIIPDATVQPTSIRPSTPPPVRVAYSWLVSIVPPLLVHPAAAGRAPPAA
jgi:hypothetical protein